MTAYPQPKHLRFSVDEYYQMYKSGIGEYYERAEIIDGELIEKMFIGDFHASVVNTLNKFFVKNVSDDILVSVQNPVRLSDFDEPKPDVALADLTKYDGKRHPRPGEVLLIVEVADTIAHRIYLGKVEIPLYAKTEIPEVWLIDLQCETVVIYAKPLEGTYRFGRLFNRGEILESETVPNLKLEVDKIFG